MTAEEYIKYFSSYEGGYEFVPTGCALKAIEIAKQEAREQMLKDALSGFIKRNSYTKINVLRGLDITCDAIQKFKDGDKVKLIIIKEE